MRSTKIRSYSELKNLDTFEERYKYLRLSGSVGKDTFGYDRYLNQVFYKSREWQRARDSVLIRDNGCDLGLDGYRIYGYIIIHHMNPISVDDINNRNMKIFDPEFLICVSHKTHLAIHYGDESLLPQVPIIRHPGDTAPWLFSKK